MQTYVLLPELDELLGVPGFGLRDPIAGRAEEQGPVRPPQPQLPLTTHFGRVNEALNACSRRLPAHRALRAGRAMRAGLRFGTRGRGDARLERAGRRRKPRLHHRQSTPTAMASTAASPTASAAASRSRPPIASRRRSRRRTSFRKIERDEITGAVPTAATTLAPEAARASSRSSARADFRAAHPRMPGIRFEPAFRDDASATSPPSPRISERRRSRPTA